ncbi:MarR family winged helix-turn-helix transcriptional regulator [Turneriella parva]|jgi:MarR family transcriptional regulator for hemolysin|uniref:Regulatory protein MarR n=1 Tax=Turneriella parva (strain ATCC BAA-1111 / DSM 21527 / NCTC 11395 / H) TaxID=869212 RepID=I4B0S9_TURPD|nr:winged helix DNA-binding protein [Turneriella parva]AFM10886.1 regulatory protein MarR [Turneriella parva DSM 21527]
MLMPANPLMSHQNAPSAVLLIRGGRIAASMLEGKLSKLGLTVPYATILTALLEHGSKSATDLCILTMRERANMSVLLGKLRKIEYVSETPNPLDARSQLISLTEKGRELAVECRQVTNEVSEIIDNFLQSQSEDPQKFKGALSEFLGKFHSLYV